MTCDHTGGMYGRSDLIQCHCYCDVCWTEGEGECVCGDCDHRFVLPLHPAYFANKVEPEAHTCSECDTEVFRKSNRGRWPLKCTACKELV